MRALIVEDEMNVLSGFIKLLQTFCPEVTVVGTAENVEKGVALINDTTFDVLFLDINLPDGSGFDLLHQLRQRDFHTVFVTAYDQYAIDAFKISAVDYLLKPISPELLKKAIDKIKHLEGLVDQNDQLEVIQKRIEAEYNQHEKIILRDTEGMRIEEISSIVYCEAEGSYTKFHFKGGETVLTSLHLKEYERLLEPYGFIRCHHSYLINLQHVLAVHKNDGGVIVLSGQITLPLSTRKKSGVVDAIKERFIN